MKLERKVGPDVFEQKNGGGDVVDDEVDEQAHGLDVQIVRQNSAPRVGELIQLMLNLTCWTYKGGGGRLLLRRRRQRSSQNI